MIANANVNISVNINQSTSTNTAGTLTEIVLPPDQQPLYAWTNGTASGQCDLLWSISSTLTASTVDYDLTNLTGIDGSTINFARVKYMLLRHLGTTDGQSLTVGGASSNPWTGYMSGTEDIEAGGMVERMAKYANGYLVTPTSKILQLNSGSATIPLKLILLGSSAQGKSERIQYIP